MSSEISNRSSGGGLETKDSGKTCVKIRCMCQYYDELSTVHLERCDRDDGSESMKVNYIFLDAVEYF